VAGLSATRTLGDINSAWVEVRCRNTRVVRAGKSCADKGYGLGRMLGRYTTECLVQGAQIELKCPDCNQITLVRSS
jgi:hypothetical protein